jgi:hypothetical protein
MDKLSSAPLPPALIHEIEGIQMPAHKVQAKMTLTIGASRQMRARRILLISRARNRGVNSSGRLRWLLLATLWAAVCIAPEGQQSNQSNQDPFAKQRHQAAYGDGIFDDNNNAFVERQLKALNAERQKALVSDTEKLLKLAQELNTEIATSNPQKLNSGQMHKIADIEKLAHNVKQKMSESMVSGPQLHEPIAPPRQP